MATRATMKKTRAGRAPAPKRKTKAVVPKKASATPKKKRATRASSKKTVPVVLNPYADAVPGKSKASASFALIHDTYDSVGLAPDNQESFERLLKKFSASSTWVYVCVMRIAQAAAQLPFQIIVRKKENKPGAIETDGVGGLRDLLEHPNPYQCRFDFIESIFVSLELTGNCYIEKAEITRGKPKELYVLNPAQMSVVPDKKKLVKGYILNVNGKALEYKADEIIHIKYAHSSSMHYGMSPLTAARVAINIDQGALRWNSNFMDHGGWPAGSIETDNDVDDKTLRRMKNELRTVVQQGKRQAGRVMLLTGGMKYKAIAVTPKDMDWLNARRFSRDELLAIYNVPFSIAGLTSTEQTTARSAGIREQIRNFYQLNVFPKMNGKVLGALNRELVPAFSKTHVLRPDLRGVPVLQEDLARDYIRSQIFQKLISSGWSVNMALAELYPHQATVPWGDVFWVQSAMWPATDGTNPYLESQMPKVSDDEASTDRLPSNDRAVREGLEVAESLGINHGEQREIARLFYEVSKAESEEDVDRLLDQLDNVIV